ncbi:MAG: histidine phosphatase family protein [Pseudomonadota bacterium]
MKALWVIRHAKSSWADPGQDDFERPLNDRGRRDGPLMARWLAAQPLRADWLITSTAARARATAAFVADGFGLGRRGTVEEPGLYHAAPHDLLDAAREAPPTCDCVALVAHNPGMTALVNQLAGARVIDNLPTFGCAAFLLAEEDWANAGYGAATFVAFATPKLLSPR